MQTYELSYEEFQAVRETMLQLSTLTCLTAQYDGESGLTNEELNAVFSNAWLPLKDVVEACELRCKAQAVLDGGTVAGQPVGSNDKWVRRSVSRR